MQAMILAAGFGTRLRPLSDRRPKALCPVWGRPMLDHWIHKLAAEGCTRVVVNAHHHAERLIRFVADRRWPVPVEVLREERILGTGGAIRNALDILEKAPFVVVNADVLCSVSIKELWAEHRRNGRDVTLLLCRSPRFDSVLVDERSLRIRSFRSFRGRPGSNRLWTFTGIQVVDPRVFAPLPSKTPFHVIDFYEERMEKGRAPAAVCRKDLWWREMGSLESYWAVHEEGFRGNSPELEAFLSGRSVSRIAADARVHPRARLSRMIFLGSKATVEGGAELRDVIVWENARIESGASLERCVVMDGVVATGRHRNAVLLPDGKVCCLHEPSATQGDPGCLGK